MKPADAIDQAEAARILGCSVTTVNRLVSRGELTSHRSHPSLSRAQVEWVAEQSRRHRLTPSQAAVHRDVSVGTVRRWLRTGVLPGTQAPTGRWQINSMDVWRVRTQGPDLVTRQQAAVILGVSRGRVTRSEMQI